MRQPGRSRRAAMMAGAAVAGLTAALLVAPGADAADDPVPPAPAPAVLAPINVATATTPAPTAAGVSAAVARC